MTIASFLTPMGCAKNKSQNVEQVFSKPLITGASVSADWASLSPGKRLALRYTAPKNIKTVAFGGRPGIETIKHFNRKDLSDRTSIIAVDFFFWDSVLEAHEPSVKALNELVGRAAEADIPVVLGEIPELLPGRQPQRIKLNAAIQKKCAEYKSCYLMPFDRLHRQVLQEGYWQVNNKKLTLREIVPDGLHLSEEAGQELANIMKNLF